MADVKISALPAATTPLTGSEVLPIVQSGTTDQVSVANLTAGRTVGATAFAATGNVSGSTLTAGVGSVSAPSVTFSGDTNTGVYAPAADTVAIAAGGVETVRTNSGGDFRFNSGYGSVATAYGCRAWVNFNGTGTVAIRASGNVSSISDNGTGDYTVNFTTAMPNANYTVTATAGSTTLLTGIYIACGDESSAAPTASAFKIRTINQSVYADLSNVYVAFFR